MSGPTPKERVQIIEGFIFWLFLLLASTYSLFENIFTSQTALTVLLAVFMISAALFVGHLGSITASVLNDYQVAFLRGLVAFIESNRERLGYIILGIVTLAVLSYMWQKEMITNEGIIGTVVLELLFVAWFHFSGNINKFFARLAKKKR